MTLTAAKTHEIAQECQLIEVARAWRAYTHLFTASLKATELGISDDDQAAMNRAESRDYLAATKATRAALNLGIHARRIGKVIKAAKEEGRSDARDMMPDEIASLVDMFND